MLIVQLLAVNVDTIGVQKIVAVMSGIKIGGQAVSSVKQKAMTSMTSGLVQKQLIRKNNMGLTCNPELRLYVILELLANGQYKKFAKRMRKQAPVQKQFGKVIYSSYNQCVRELQYYCYAGDSPGKISTSFNGMDEYFRDDKSGRFLLEDILPVNSARKYARYLSRPVLFYILVQLLDSISTRRLSYPQLNNSNPLSSSRPERPSMKSSLTA